MTTSQRRISSRRRLCSLGVLAALFAQMALIALHAVETAGSVPRSQTREAQAGAVAALAPAAQPEGRHNPASCPVCQSLLRTKPAVAAPTSREEPRAALAAAPSVPELRAPSGVARSGHPPRAPPSETRQLG
jgi:hypothetical protein